MLTEIVDRRRVLLREVLAFGLVGGFNFALDLGVYQLMYDVAGLGALVSKVISTVVSTASAFFMHKHWSFGHRQGREQPHEEFVIFLVLSVVSLLLGLAVIGFAHYVLRVEGVLGLQIANIVSIGLATLFRFFAYRRWVFVE